MEKSIVAPKQRENSVFSRKTNKNGKNKKLSWQAQIFPFEVDSIGIKNFFIVVYYAASNYI